jgi:CBS domain-containing protein
LLNRRKLVDTPSSLATANRLTLCADTAGDLMVASPTSLRSSATVEEAIALLADRGLSAAPVIDDAGHPIGVISQSDILLHKRESRQPPGSGQAASLVQDLMTPAVFSIAQEVPATRVIEDLLALNVQQLFVVDEGGALIGMISTRDVLRKLQLDCA